VATLAETNQALLSLVNTVGGVAQFLGAVALRDPLVFGTGLGGIVAAPGGVANAVPLTAYVNEITEANPGDSAKLAPSAAGMVQLVGNSAANAVDLYGEGGDLINGSAAAYVLGSGKNAIFFCARTGFWRAVLSL
jgi:hypothetical protein